MGVIRLNYKYTARKTNMDLEIRICPECKRALPLKKFPVSVITNARNRLCEDCQPMSNQSDLGVQL